MANSLKTMSKVLTGSVVLKGIGAALEIVVQVFITRSMGVAGYGDYSFYISAADLVFWFLFSGIIKCNVYYLSDGATTLSSFKKKYYGFFVAPIFILFAIAAILFGSVLFLLADLILIAHVFLFDWSSQFLARGKYSVSLSGEYIIGRLVLMVLVIVLHFAHAMTIETLLIAYLLQIIMVDVFFLIKRKTLPISQKTLNEPHVSLQKLWRFQETDIVTSLIGQAPVILQYIVTDAFSAGLVSIVALIRKVVNFFSGPTAKVFLPEFAKLSKEGNKEKVKEFYQAIVRIQMLFVSVMAVLLLGCPKLVLSVFSPDLEAYTGVFQLVSFVFLLTASMGPAGGLLQMSGHEKAVSYVKYIAAAVMIAIWFLLSSVDLFVLYGICAELLIETVIYYVLVCKFFSGLPVPVVTYIRIWVPSLLTVIILFGTGFGETWAGLVVAVVLVGALQLAIEAKSGIFSWLVKGEKDA